MEFEFYKVFLHFLQTIILKIQGFARTATIFILDIHTSISKVEDLHCSKISLTQLDDGSDGRNDLTVWAYERRLSNVAGYSLICDCRLVSNHTFGTLFSKAALSQ